MNRESKNWKDGIQGSTLCLWTYARTFCRLWNEERGEEKKPSSAPGSQPRRDLNVCIRSTLLLARSQGWSRMSVNSTCDADDEAADAGLLCGRYTIPRDVYENPPIHSCHAERSM